MDAERASRRSYEKQAQTLGRSTSFPPPPFPLSILRSLFSLIWKIFDRPGPTVVGGDPRQGGPCVLVITSQGSSGRHAGQGEKSKQASDVFLFCWCVFVCGCDQRGIPFLSWDPFGQFVFELVQETHCF